MSIDGIESARAALDELLADPRGFNWDRICDLIGEWMESAGVEELVSAAEEGLAAWPEEIDRVAPRAWVPLYLEAEAHPALRLPNHLVFQYPDPAQLEQLVEAPGVGLNPAGLRAFARERGKDDGSGLPPHSPGGPPWRRWSRSTSTRTPSETRASRSCSAPPG
ncbi:MAG: hypothetical protein JRS35_25645 [Deltaproteobacteria bacterium]|nr:hypothetical protein [Deltaproteobacteria bacterium]